ncbi:DNA polymerase IV [Cocleimonas sp. KMM 6892]|uniref:DNA polymerase IV n=1 Tax=unclassified Cocleimonas TaxID=2639732 RepID=UPI002DBB404F|nr:MULTISPECIES: DNA polymerase IV [unclassified Cocleimonas]MEB8430862.1 DNA polymerase IV [Cocleimonas sp. KMM 6892]MEC4714366.1 DNA polymerase IV [Cocleimonas sp. KMM 6895]MEC4743697.1 DNA polymerase IV [Cocleimonas sp. KMM 6896]
MSTEDGLNRSMMRKIIHVDMDCFYAAVEVRENPQLQGKPVAVGGSPQSRGVVAACNYEARKFGVHSAMPMSRAFQQCPSLITTPVHMDLYKQISGEIHQIFQDYTDQIEPLSLDEAYLDVSESSHCGGSATLIAQQIRERIFDTQRLTASAGVAPNKFLAKVASDWNKPNGQKVITPDDVQEFVKALHVKAISGVGKVTAKRMSELNIETCEDLNKMGLDKLNQYFGSFGEQLYKYSQGIDTRPVQTHWVRKSLSVEDTFAQDLPDLESCLLELTKIYAELLVRLERAQKKQRLIPKALFVKLRFDDFETTTIQMVGNKPDKHAYMRLCADAWLRGQRPVRLIGLGLQFNPPDMPEQLRLI